MQSSLFHSLVFVGIAGGCLGTARFGASSDLVVISPGVQVVADYDEPIFFSDSYYWRNTGDGWYRSTNRSGGWARVDVAPVAIRSIEHPSAYAHYHREGPANAGRSRPEARARSEVAAPARGREVHGEANRAPKEHQKEVRKDKKHDRE